MSFLMQSAVKHHAPIRNYRWPPSIAMLPERQSKTHENEPWRRWRLTPAPLSLRHFSDAVRRSAVRAIRIPTVSDTTGAPRSTNHFPADSLATHQRAVESVCDIHQTYGRAHSSRTRIVSPLLGRRSWCALYPCSLSHCCMKRSTGWGATENGLPSYKGLFRTSLFGSWWTLSCCCSLLTKLRSLSSTDPHNTHSRLSSCLPDPRFVHFCTFPAPRVGQSLLLVRLTEDGPTLHAIHDPSLAYPCSHTEHSSLSYSLCARLEGRSRQDSCPSPPKDEDVPKSRSDMAAQIYVDACSARS